MKIYKKTGDRGETGFIGGRISKGSDKMELIGALDEFNASLGIVVSLIKNTSKLKARTSELTSIQSSIFSIGAIIAGGKSKANFPKLTKDLENSIDKMEKDLTPLQNFILPGGSLIASQIHLARTICRRVERELVRFNEAYPLPITHHPLLSYLNRLSDFLFVLARHVNLALGEGDIIWSENA